MLYFDYAATTPMDKNCIKFFEEYGVNNFFNPSALYSPSVGISNAISNARKEVCKYIGGASSDDIIFTASGSEANNLALLCTSLRKTGKILIGGGEHSAIYNTALELKNRGFFVCFLKTDQFGAIDMQDFAEQLTEDTTLISIMHVSNETGAINDIEKIAKLAKKANPKVILHSDGVQAVGKIQVNMQTLGVDLYSISGHKINAPKGIGCLFVKKGTSLKPIIFGGGQEKGVRSATENVAGILSFAYCLKNEILALKTSFYAKKAIQKYVFEQLNNNFQDIKINTNIDFSAPHILSFAFKNVRGEVMVHSLEKHNIFIGTGSACSSTKSSKRIPKALGLSNGYEDGMLRISFCETTTKNEIDKLIEKMKKEYEILINYKRI